MPVELPPGLVRMRRELERLAASPQADDPTTAWRLALMSRRGAHREEEYLARVGRGADDEDEDEDGDDIHRTVYGPR
ncbi:MAG: hypothetical protein GEV28_00205 [Actinophytocola sp.]|uniref:hypothetical protein n=1 Tax=Actinophytocola sp. TaxID=1872138 RepID=UPI0013208466|nr:hypothetical protein [Actinophytocola sp.]MPZ78893.1 hypothetical protein [Actinophytocola sp.]